MSKVIAAIDNSPAARPVLAASAAIADLLQADLEALHVCEDGDAAARSAAEVAGVPISVRRGPVVSTLAEAGRPPVVAAVVVGARALATGPRPAGHVALQLAGVLPKPLVVVPPDATVPSRVGRILVPLDGSRATADALAETMVLASARDVELVVLHVRDVASIPLFNDQPHHEAEAWTHEFLRRNCPHPDRIRLEVRIGIPGRHVLTMAERATVDLIALGWSQHLGEGRAAVIREVLERSGVPVLLVPVPARVPADDDHPSPRSRLLV
jgi:hypothetical protein